MNNIQFSTKSMVDDFGRVFFLNGKIYRAIHKSSINFCLELLNSKLYEELFELGLIPKTKISEIVVPGYELILEHERLTEIQQHEWSFQMFKEVALSVLKTNEICNKYGYELKDAHTYNVLFRGVQPVYADFGSITKKNSSDWIAYNEFYCVFYLPLLFLKKNELFIFRKLVESNFYRMQTAPFQDFMDSGLIKLIDSNPFQFYLKFRSKIILNNYVYDKKTAFISKLLNKLISILLFRKIRFFKYEKYHYNTVPYCDIQRSIVELEINKIKSQWEGYHNENYLSNNKFKPSERFNIILNIVKSIEPELHSVIDLAGNEGLFTSLLLQKTKIKRLIVADYDSNAIDVAYRNFQKYDSEKRVSVALLNFIFTSNIEHTSERLKSDLVIALAVTHHLILTQNYSIDVIFERLKMFSNRYVIVEFMPLGLWSIHTKIGTTPPEWYNFEWFKSKFNTYFNIITIETIEENRIVFVGEIK